MSWSQIFRKIETSNILTVSVCHRLQNQMVDSSTGQFGQEAYPDLQLRIQANDREVNFQRAELCGDSA